jgi:hypothetical protein
VEQVFEDIRMFEEVLTLSQKQEKTENQETFIFRQIKLEKELRKLKKKIHDNLTKDQLRKLLPYEEFLQRALIDESENEDEESAYASARQPSISP